MPSDREIEIQVKVESVKPLLDFLEKNAKFKREVRQLDEYYSPKHRNFLDSDPVKEWLRLRDSEGKSSITYKNYHYEDSRVNSWCDEFESEIGNIEKVRKIMYALDFNLVTKVDKVRKIWDFKDYEISIDAVKTLGDFVEIEYKGVAEEDPQKIMGEMVSFLKGLGCGKITANKYGYAFMMAFPEKEQQHEL